jgi:hypothetical protein
MQQESFLIYFDYFDNKLSVEWHGSVIQIIMFLSITQRNRALIQISIGEANGGSSCQDTADFDSFITPDITPDDIASGTGMDPDALQESTDIATTAASNALFGGDGIVLGTTPIRINASSEQTEQLAGVLQDLYETSPAFAQAIDSRGQNGVNITVDALSGNVEGFATVGGNNITLNSEALQDPDRAGATIAHELAHNLGLNHGPELDDFTNTVIAQAGLQGVTNVGGTLQITA